MGHPLIFMCDFMFALLAFVLMFVIGIFYVHVSQFNTYVGETEQITRRAGGFNNYVKDDCNDISRKFYLPGCTSSNFYSSESASPSKPLFHVEPYNYSATNHSNSDAQYQDVGYGRVIRYRVFTRIPMATHILSNYTRGGTPISVISRVRKGSQEQIYDNYNNNL